MVSDAERRIEAYYCLKNVASSASVAPHHAITTSNETPNRSQTTEGHTLGRNKASVSGAFKEDDKYTGYVSGKVPLHRVRKKFLDAVRDQAIPCGDQVDLLYCCFEGMALDYYYKSIRGICQTVDEAFKAFETRFNSLQHQAQAISYLKKLTIDSIKREKECSTTVALELAHDRIISTVPSCGRDYQSDSHYYDLLEDIVRDENWVGRVVQDRLTPSPTGQMECNTFYSKLCAALTSYERHNVSRDVSSSNSGTPAVFYGERHAVPVRKEHRPRTHPRSYGRQQSGGALNIRYMLRAPSRVKGRLSPEQLAQLKARTNCLRCKQMGHWRHEYPERMSSTSRSVMMALVQELRNDEAAVAKTLWALGEDGDEYYAYVARQTPEDRVTVPSHDNSSEAVVNTVETTDSLFGNIEADQDPIGRLMRWRLRLSEFNFDVQYKKGRLNTQADALSRLKTLGETQPSIDEEILCFLAERSPEEWTNSNKFNETGYELYDEVLATEAAIPSQTLLRAITAEELVYAQHGDVYCTVLRSRLNEGERLPFSLYENGILIRHAEGNTQIVIPYVLRALVLHLSHHAKLAGHPGGRKLYYTLRQHFYWPSMSVDAYATASRCATCARNRIKLRRHTKPLQLFPARASLEYLSIDILGELIRTPRGNRYLLVITDRFSKLVRIVPLKKISAAEAAKAVVPDWVFVYGLPVFLLSDNGSQFIPKYFRDICLILRVENVFTTKYHPQKMGRWSVSIAQ